jgi:hypothetical protein
MRTASAAGVASLLVATLAPIPAIGAGSIASSNFVGAENPLNENGAWVPMFSMSPDHVQFQKNYGAYADSFNGAHNNHPAARTTTAVPADQYSELVVGHIGSNRAYVGPTVRVQTGGPAVDSQYTWWASLAGGDNLELYRFDCNGTSYTAQRLTPNTPVVDGDTLRLIARGPVIYGIKNGVRDFIYNTGKDAVRYDGGTTGILAYSAGPTLTDATIASWSTGAAPTSSGTWASSTFDGDEGPLDEGDRWYPLPGSSGFKKTGGLAMSNSPYEMGNYTGVWSIAPPPTQYSEVTLGPVDLSSGGGVLVRIDRTALGPTGWMLFMWADSNRYGSGIFKLNPAGDATLVRPFTPTVVPGDKWRLAATGNTLEVFRNGASQFTYTTDGSYATGDVGINAYSSTFTFDAWEGGGTLPAPATVTDFAPTSGPVGTSVQINGANFGGATSVAFNGANASFSVASATVIQASVPSGATTGPISVTTPGGTASSAGQFTVTPSPPTVTSFAPTSGSVGTSVQIHGANFSGASSVTFNGVSATFSVTSATVIHATVPAAATPGAISVNTSGGTATSADNFTVTASLSVAKTSTLGVGQGTVSSTSSPGTANQIDCGPKCSVDFVYGTVVTLTATPGLLSLFDAWTGCDSTSGTICTVGMKSARTVTARFLP